MWMWGAAGLIVILISYVFFYNQLIKLDALTKEAWSSIDVQLKRRHDLIPNLVETVQGYTTYEKNLLEEIIALRNHAKNAANIAEQQTTEIQLSYNLKQLCALAERYPDLKADIQFTILQENLSIIENDLQSARRYYNTTVRDYNVALHTIPSCWIAQSMKAEDKNFFEISEQEYANIKIDFKANS